MKGHFGGKGKELLIFWGLWKESGFVSTLQTGELSAACWFLVKRRAVPLFSPTPRHSPMPTWRL